MIENFKAMVFVLLLATCVFAVTKPVMLRYTSEGDWKRRRNAWMALTIVAYLSPSFWLYALIAAPVFVWTSRKDSNPVAVYLLLLQVIPQISVPIPVVGIKTLFSLDNYRLLSIFVLLPALWRTPADGQVNGVKTSRLLGALILAYGALLVINQSSYTSFTVSLRSTFLYIVDVYLVYVAVSKWSTTRHSISDALASLFLACAILAIIAVFESTKHWLVYALIEQRWTGVVNVFYLVRYGMLRPSASSGNVLVLGYLLAIGLGLWLEIKKESESRTRNLTIWLAFIVGLILTYSRGPWAGAVVIALTRMFFSEASLKAHIKTVGSIAVVAICIGLSPLGDRIIRALPFFGGTEGIDTIIYRERLLERSLTLIKENLFFGDQLVLAKMEDLRQGMGIIDIVNTYVEVTLYNGIVGLALFLSPLLIALARVYGGFGKVNRLDPALARLGVTISSCIVGTLVMLGTCSFIFAYQKIYYVLIGLSAGYVMAARAELLRGQDLIGAVSARAR